MYFEVAWVLVSSVTQVQPQVILDLDYLPDYLFRLSLIILGVAEVNQFNQNFFIFSTFKLAIAHIMK